MKIGKLSLYQQFKQFRRNIGPSTFIETPEYIMWSNLMILVWFRIPVVVERVSYWKFRPQVSKRFVILETTSLLQVQRKISMVQSAACCKSMFYDRPLMNVTVRLCLTGSRWGDNVLSSLEKYHNKKGTNFL